MSLKTDLENLIDGDVRDDHETLEAHSKDTSLFQVWPQLVVYPKGVEDVKKLVRYVTDHKSEHPDLSLTGRSAGTDMSGGPLSESIILDFTHYFRRDEVDEENLTAQVEPGVYYHDFEKITLPDNISMPTYPASKSLAAFGGMIMNNCGGERTLRYGQMRDWVSELVMVLADGNEYTIRPLNRTELEAKMAQNDFEGEIYRQIFHLVDDNYDLIQAHKPQVSKNSSGYALWRVWNKETFDLTQLFIGSQGTLGLLTSAKIRLLKEKSHNRMVVLFMPNWDELPAVVNALLPFTPESLEAFDDSTLKLGIRFMPEIARQTKSNLLSFMWRFLPEAWIGIKMLGLPKLIIIVELAEDNEAALDEKAKGILIATESFNLYARVLTDEREAEKYWVMRRQSFNLLRQHVAGKRTVPLVDDFCVAPEKIPEFLPQALAILKRYGIQANITGHVGNGNFHIIPLMDLTKAKNRAKLPQVATEFYDLVIKYGGTISAEHNDGILRTPFVEKMFGTEMYHLFQAVKKILDPQTIFNPGKKVNGTLEYMEEHIAAS
jgi:FAD/FMN-containing dehydrogenase